MDFFNFGKNLRRIRVNKGVSQEAISFHLDISQSKYCRMEGQALPPSIEEVKAIARVLNIPAKALLPGPEELVLRPLVYLMEGHHETEDIALVWVSELILTCCWIFFAILAYFAVAEFCNGLHASFGLGKLLSWLAIIAVLYMKTIIMGRADEISKSRISKRR